MIALYDQYLSDTLLWTGILIAVVLLARRPVARLCGPGVAYALWLLPFLRLILPPLTLPASMRPAPDPAAEVAFAMAEPMPVAELGAMALPGSAAAAPQFAATSLLVLVWVAGVAVFLLRRFWLYFTLRGQLLARSRPVGEFGRIRLVESAAISGPVAFGVWDKVIALPSGFMAAHDRTARDLAIAHEIQHHHGHDLLFNVLVQPLFALHWWNPLGYAGWRALRRDQEAACDARVVANLDRAARARYAGVIADFARRPTAMPRPALAAAMACPVLGDKSVIQRLRNLTMADLSPRRRLAGRLLVGTAFLAVPATASIAYADAAAPTAAEPAAAPAAGAGANGSAAEAKVVTEGRDVEIIRTGSGATARTVVVNRVRDADGQVHVTRRVITGDAEDWSAEDQADFARDMADLERDLAESAREIEAETAEIDREVAAGLREMERELARELRAEGVSATYRQAAVQQAKRAQRNAAKASAMAPEVVEGCPEPSNPVTTQTLADGRVRIILCKSAGETIRREALRQARESAASARRLSDEARADTLRALDREIERDDQISTIVPLLHRASFQNAEEDCPEERRSISRSV